MAEYTHEWGEWEKMLWYTPKGRFIGEARRCRKCSAVETRNVEVDSRPRVVQPTIGVFAGIFNEEGKSFLRRLLVEGFPENGTCLAEALMLQGLPNLQMKGYLGKS